MTDLRGRYVNREMLAWALAFTLLGFGLAALTAVVIY